MSHPAVSAKTNSPSNKDQQDENQLRYTLSRALHAGMEFLAHTALLAVLLLCMWMLERLTGSLWGDNKVFHIGTQSIALHRLFDGGDLFPDPRNNANW